MKTSKEIIDRAKKRFKELEHKNYDWRSFYTGFLEASMQVKNNASLDSVSVSDLEFKAALTLLRDLADLQNGAPLERYRKEWDEVMTSTYDFLEQHSR